MLAWSSAARADETPATRSALLAPRLDQPYTLAQLGVGVLTLPAASVCLATLPCTKGDTSIEANFWQFYRANRLFAIGAGASVALRPTSDTTTTETGQARNHSRSYFLVEGQGRFYFVHAIPFEAYLGATVGGIVLSDRYSNPGSAPVTIAIIGPRVITLRTEGLSLGGVLGFSWFFAANWALGASVRYLRWFLPHEAATTVFLDRASLTDQQSAFDLGFSATYRIAL